MSIRSHYNCLEIGDVVRVRMSGGRLGDTRYEIVQKNDRLARQFLLGIREISDARTYKTQYIDASLLALEPSNERLQKSWDASMPSFFRR